MKAKIVTLDNKEAGDIALNADVFGAEVRKDILHRVVRWQLAARQSGNHKTKLKSEVHGTTKKPHNQKGTGNARQGDRTGPHMRGGYMAHGPVVRSHAIGLNKKVRALGLKCALSHMALTKKLVILKDAELKAAKAKDLLKNLAALNLTKSVLVIDGEMVNQNFLKAAGNLHGIDILPTQGINVYDILKHDTLLLTVSAVEALTKRLAK